MATDFCLYPRSINGLDLSSYMNELENTGQNSWTNFLRYWTSVNEEQGSLRLGEGIGWYFLKVTWDFRGYWTGHVISKMMETLRQARQGRHTNASVLIWDFLFFCFFPLFCFCELLGTLFIFKSQTESL